MKVSDDKLKQIIADGMNDMFAAVQNEIGVTTGDIASMFWHGRVEEDVTEQLLGVFRDYLRSEEAHAQPVGGDWS